MLNAASANGPREIQIGLPSADVNVLENGIPITYATNPHGINSMWRTDASLAHVGLQKISETAITTGNIGYAVNSFTRLGEAGFHGNLNYKANHFGQQEFSLNLRGSIANGWYYSASMYQDFDPGTFKVKGASIKTARKSTNSRSPSATMATVANLPHYLITPTATRHTIMPHKAHPLFMWAMAV